MNLQEMQNYVGKVGQIPYERLYIDVAIEDVKTSYGRPRFLVTPLSGSGSMWIEKIILPEEIIQ